MKGRGAIERICKFAANERFLGCEFGDSFDLFDVRLGKVNRRRANTSSTCSGSRTNNGRRSTRIRAHLVLSESAVKKQLLTPASSPQ